jgi:hypothetical protein
MFGLITNGPREPAPAAMGEGGTRVSGRVRGQHGDRPHRVLDHLLQGRQGVVAAADGSARMPSGASLAPRLPANMGLSRTVDLRQRYVLFTSPRSLIRQLGNFRPRTASMRAAAVATHALVPKARDGPPAAQRTPAPALATNVPAPIATS